MKIPSFPGPGSIIICLFIGACAYGILPFKWGLLYSMLFGAILSATDPVSVVDLLKRTKASSKLTTIIAGESLLNDGSAMILYLFFANLCEGNTYTAESFILFVLQMLVLSPLIGFGFGYVCYRITKLLQKNVEINMDIIIVLSVFCAYGSFFCAANLLGVSGVLSCCTSGICYSVFVSTAVLESEKMLHVWHHLEWLCNTLIFMLAGVVGGASTFGALEVLYVLVMYVVLLLTRGVAIAWLYPLLNRIGKPLNPKEAFFAGEHGHYYCKIVILLYQKATTSLLYLSFKLVFQAALFYFCAWITNLKH